ncbi:MAG: type II toxin-antitoxin system VapC family toxin [Bacteroidetes bacterium]|nr:type II toxin-antitoxin system VapC family toxin [Bacteroidota bacterium]
MGKKYLIDSNTLIDYVGNKLPKSAAEAMDRVVDEAFNVSIVVKIETLGFDGEASEMEKLRSFLSLASVFYLDDSIVDQTIALRKAHKKLKLGDALIAATALVHNFTLLTRNTKDFEFIPGLDCANPYEF